METYSSEMMGKYISSRKELLEDFEGVLSLVPENLGEKPQMVIMITLRNLAEISEKLDTEIPRVQGIRFCLESLNLDKSENSDFEEIYNTIDGICEGFLSVYNRIKSVVLPLAEKMMKD